jgi:hypothetical protein
VSRSGIWLIDVRPAPLRRGEGDMRTKERMIHQYVRETFSPETPVPGYRTVCRIWREWFGPGGARQRLADLCAIGGA